MSININTLSTDSPAEKITLGDVCMTAEKFSLRVQRPTVRHVLSSGAHTVTVLGELPCTLTLGGRIIPDDGGALPARIQALLSADSVYAFTCRGMRFQGMRITELTCSTEQNAHEAAMTVVLIGKLKEVQE